LHLNLSNNGFTAGAMISLFKILTCRPFTIPIVFEAAEIALKPAFFNKLSEEIAFENCFPNIAELDWSGNQFPANSQFFFAFLYTQKRLRLLRILNIHTNDSIQFLQFLMTIGRSLPIYGLDLCGTFDPLVFAQFIQALTTWQSLRRLNLSGCGAGEGGLGALNEVITELPDLNELGADGFRPTAPELLIPLWTTAASLQNLVACDLPILDLERLKVQAEQIPGHFPEAFANLKQRARLSTAEQRVQVTLKSLGGDNGPMFSDDVFFEVGQMDWGKSLLYEQGNEPESVSVASADDE
jgi:hypothetical protein